ncbi:MAG: hypothetical protein QNJ74_06975 [Trichodesmium sp. MO_231.B1]|nr:hypothetical protein [Trichodesmium sp. MO_231.B1]
MPRENFPQWKDGDREIVYSITNISVSFLIARLEKSQFAGIYRISSRVA